MTTQAALLATELDVTPGEAASLTLKLRNTGTIVEGYRFTVVGAASAWTRVEPAEMTLYPDTEGEARIIFDPPRTSDVRAGAVAFAVQVTPQEQPETATAPEGVVTVLPFSETTAELTPRTAGGRLYGRTEVAVDNRGNVPVRFHVTAKDADDNLRFESRPDEQPATPGQAVFHKLSIRARKPRWRGPAQTLPYAVAVTTLDDKGEETHPPVVLDGSLVQNAILPRNLFRWVIALIALAALLGAGWLFLLKPAVTSAAQNAVETPVEQLKQEVAKAKENADDAKKGVDEIKATPPVVPSAPPTSKPPETTTAPFSGRVEVAANGNAAATQSYTVPEKTTFTLTDLLIMNPQGDQGRVDVEINGVVVHTLSLANFRDWDNHYVTGLQVPEKKSIVLRLTCTTPGPRLAGTSSDQCRTFLSFSGTTVTKKPAA
ncbi:hypothetical protein Afil01_51480 [Actinorhabdospora filicis]|uniref:Hydrolytic protein n=1 Tax=Actinorhabdospora filicis TaxID=1785913 RepID=A0A9W6SQD9_9ACTN|nr:hypothetical protein [Actinorhabdospora filicis]GLZ80341.1 hypothetical protein Afil01_51480 [Actinorhabdospora filicis]